MTFQELLDDYLAQLGCTARELSAVSGRIRSSRITVENGEMIITELTQ